QRRTEGRHAEGDRESRRLYPHGARPAHPAAPHAGTSVQIRRIDRVWKPDRSAVGQIERKRSGTMNTTMDNYEEQLERAASFIRSGEETLVVSHVHPDGDAAGSTFAVGWMLEQLGIRHTMINEGPMPRKYDLLPGYD